MDGVGVQKSLQYLMDDCGLCVEFGLKDVHFVKIVHDMKAPMIQPD